MNKKPELAVIGGDSRQIYAAEHFVKKGFDVKIFGCELENITDKLLHCNNLKEATDSTILVFPLPFTKNNKYINSPLSEKNIAISEILEMIKSNHNIFLGMANNSIIRHFRCKTNEVTDYYSDESFMLKNALLTAEGIINIMTDKLPTTLNGLNVAITGYGRIAYFTAKLLKNMGAFITISARSKEQLVKAELDGHKTISLTNIGDGINKFDCIINTIPHQIINYELINLSKKDCVFIETASSPYGINADDCNKSGRLLIKAFSLPGKNSPKSAGIIIADTISEKLKEVQL